MGKRKQLVKELEAALAQMEQDWRIEHENAGLMERNMLRNIAEKNAERQRHNMIVDAMTAGMQRLTEERDELRLELAGMTSDAALDAAMADIETLTQANEEADATIGALRDDLADMRERLDAALTEATRMRKEWAGDVTAAREVIERKSNEIVELRRDVAAAQRERDAALGYWKNAEDLLIARERELDALQEQHAGMSDARDDLLESLACANALIGNIRLERDGLHGRCAALSDELDALKAAQAQQQEYASQWGALCFRLGIAKASHFDAVVQAAQAQAAPAEPVAVNAVTLQKIDALDIGDWNVLNHEL